MNNDLTHNTWSHVADDAPNDAPNDSWIIWVLDSFKSSHSYVRLLISGFICGRIFHATHHSYVWHDSFICVTWRSIMCDMARSYVWHDAFMCVTWRIHMCDMTHSYVWHGASICATWRIHMCDMTYSYVWHDAFIRVTWRIHVCDMTRWSVWRDVFMCVTWLIDMCVTTYRVAKTHRIPYLYRSIIGLFCRKWRIWVYAS